MQNLVTFLVSLAETAFLWIVRPAEPTAPIITNGQVDRVKTLARYILSQTESLGPMPGTGGIIHALNPQQASYVAKLIVNICPQYDVHESDVVATIRTESVFDWRAIDPNHQDAKPGETADEAALHADLGIEQEDVATARYAPGMADKTIAAIESTLLDPSYGVHYVAKTVAQNLAWAAALCEKSPALAAKLPQCDPRVLGYQAYNSGQHGALLMAQNGGEFKYGLTVANRAKKLRALLDGAA